MSKLIKIGDLYFDPEEVKFIEFRHNFEDRQVDMLFKDGLVRSYNGDQAVKIWDYFNTAVTVPSSGKTARTSLSSKK